MRAINTRVYMNIYQDQYRREVRFDRLDPLEPLESDLSDLFLF